MCNSVSTYYIYSFAGSTLFYPTGVAALSILVLLVQLALHVRAQKRGTYAKLAQSKPSPTTSESLAEGVDTHVKEHDSAAILALNAVRAVAALALLGTSIYSVAQYLSNSEAGQASELVSHLAACATYVSPRSFGLPCV